MLMHPIPGGLVAIEPVQPLYPFGIVPLGYWLHVVVLDVCLELVIDGAHPQASLQHPSWESTIIKVEYLAARTSWKTQPPYFD